MGIRASRHRACGHDAFRARGGPGLLLAADDAVTAFETLADAAQLTRLAPLTTARQACEAAVRLAYLFRDEDRNVRLVRNAAYRFENGVEEGKTLDLMVTMSDAIPEWKEPQRNSKTIRSDLDAMFSSAALEYENGKLGQPVAVRMAPEEVRAPLTFNTTTAALELGDPFPLFWRLGSGASHSMPWFTFSELFAGPRGPSTSSAGANWSAAGMALLLAGRETARTIGIYAGIDVSRVIERSDTFIRALGGRQSLS